MSNQEVFVALYNKYIKREGAAELLAWLENETEFFDIRVFRRQLERLLRLLLFLTRERICRALLAVQEQGHCLGIAFAVEPLYERHRPAAVLRGMVVPCVAANGDAVVAREAFVAPRLDEMLTAHTQELLEIDRARAELLLLGEINIGSRLDHLRIIAAKTARRIIPAWDDLTGRCVAVLQYLVLDHILCHVRRFR